MTSGAPNSSPARRDIIDLGQPRIWETFTQMGREERPWSGCRPFGTWVSDDGSLVEHHVYLNGEMDDTGRARAAFQPTALLGVDVVTVPVLTGVWPWLTGQAHSASAGRSGASIDDLCDATRGTTRPPPLTVDNEVRTQISPAQKRG